MADQGYLPQRSMSDALMNESLLPAPPHGYLSSTGPLASSTPALDMVMPSKRQSLYDQLFGPPSFGEGVGLAANIIGGPALRGIRAYHGSPHKFDKFSMDRIGTGEGAQAYGHGLYFAEQEATAKSYRDALAGNRRTDYGGMQSQPAGHMYEVNLRANPEQFLDYDKRLGGQSPEVQGRVRRLAPGVTDAFHPAERVGPELAAQMREAGIPGIKYLDQGSRVIETPTKILARQEDIGARLDAIKAMPESARTQAIHNEFTALSAESHQLAQQARVAREAQQTSNYVVFDDSIIDILKRYGIVGGLSGLTAASQGDFGYQQRPSAAMNEMVGAAAQ